MNKNKKIFCAVGIAIVMIIPTIVIHVKADDPPIPFGEGHNNPINGGAIPGKGNPIYPSRQCQQLWEQTYEYGNAWGITTDKDDSVYICGNAYDGNGYLAKYDSDGTLLWTVSPKALAQPEDLGMYTQFEQPRNEQGAPISELYELRQRLGFFDGGETATILTDIFYDGQDGIIGCGEKDENMYTPQWTITVFVAKFATSDGHQIWNRTYTFYRDLGLVDPVRIVKDNQGNFYVAGIIASINFSSETLLGIHGIAMKFGSNGIMHWSTIADSLGYGIFSGVAVDSNGNPYICGSDINLTEFTTKYGLVARFNTITGDVINSFKGTGDQRFILWSMTVDTTDNNMVYAVGYGGINNSGVVCKFTPTLNLVYTSYTPDNGFSDVAVYDRTELVVVGKHWIAPHIFPTITLRPNGDGDKQLLRHPTDNTHYTAVDENISNGCTDFVYSSNAESYIQDSFNIQDHTNEVRTVQHIDVYATLKCSGPITDGIPNEGKLFVQSNGLTTYSEPVLMGENWQEVHVRFTRNPYSQDFWTWDEIDNLKIGVAFIGTMGPTTSCTQLYCVVTYDHLPNQWTISLQSKSNGRQIQGFFAGESHEGEFVSSGQAISLDTNHNIIINAGLMICEVIKCRIVSSIIPKEQEEQGNAQL